MRCLGGGGGVKAHRLWIAPAILLVVALVLLPAVPSSISGRSVLRTQVAQVLPAWEYLTIERQTELSGIIIVGQVVRVDTPKWNGSGGKQASRFSCASWDPTVYATFYVEPSQELKGEPKWGTPVAFRVEGVVTESETTDEFVATLPSVEDSSLVTRIGVGDTVVAFGEVAADRYGGGVYEPADAYWLTMGDSSLWSDEGGDFFNHGLMRDEEEKHLSLAALVSKIEGYLQDQK